MQLFNLNVSRLRQFHSSKQAILANQKKHIQPFLKGHRVTLPLSVWWTTRWQTNKEHA